MKNKPYIELKDDEGRPDQEFAVERWNAHTARNQSIIVDLMHGQYKSKLTCPKCNKVSITFDPFSSVTLPIPQKSLMEMFLYYVNLDNRSWPAKINFRGRMNETLRLARPEVARILDTENFIYATISNDEIKEVSPDNKTFNELRNNTLFAFECPANRKDFILVELRILKMRRGLMSFGRLIHVPKSATLEDVHLQLLDYFLKHYDNKPYGDTKFQFYRQNLSRFTVRMVKSGDPCVYCEEKQCRNCDLPFDGQQFADFVSEAKDRVTIELIWDIETKGVDLKHLNKCTERALPPVTKTKQPENPVVNIDECFNLFA